MESKLLGLSLSEVKILELLDKHFPLYQPSVTDNIQTIQRKAGQRDVVAFLQMYLSEDKVNY